VRSGASGDPTPYAVEAGLATLLGAKITSQNRNGSVRAAKRMAQLALPFLSIIYLHLKTSCGRMSGKGIQVQPLGNGLCCCSSTKRSTSEGQLKEAGDGWIWWGCSEHLEDWLPISPMCFQGKKQGSSKREETVMERPSPTGWYRHPMRPRLTISAFVPTADPELLCWATPDDSVGQPAECPIKDYRSPA
jgi:hypothetical protein